VIVHRFKVATEGYTDPETTEPQPTSGFVKVTHAVRDERLAGRVERTRVCSRRRGAAVAGTDRGVELGAAEA
jgi:hypothetical protein